MQTPPLPNLRMKRCALDFERRFLGMQVEGVLGTWEELARKGVTAQGGKGWRRHGPFFSLPVLPETASREQVTTNKLGIDTRQPNPIDVIAYSPFMVATPTRAKLLG